MHHGRTLSGALLSLVMAACSTNVSATSSPANVQASALPSSSPTHAPSPTPVPGDSLLPLPPLSEARYQHTATLLTDGRVLVVGGLFVDFNAEPEIVRSLSSVDVFDPTTDMWSDGPPLHRGRAEHDAVRLLDGRVLVVGGRAEDGDIIGTAELFDPATNDWTVLDDTPLDVSTALLLEDGRVLAMGYGPDQRSLTPFAAVFDPSDRSWGPAGPIDGMSLSPVGMLLDDGRVLAVGGFKADFGDGPAEPQRETALYEPATAIWSLAPSMHEARLEPARARLPDGRMLVVSNGSAEVFDPVSPEWKQVGGPLSVRDVTSLVVLSSDRILAIGDAIGNIGTKPIIEQFSAATGTWTTVAPFREIEGLTATLLGDGRVLIAGGILDCASGESCEYGVVIGDVQVFVPG